jgi:acetyltransferase-like isoleucine patch superfamily enzyme
MTNLTNSNQLEINNPSVGITVLNKLKKFLRLSTSRKKQVIAYVYQMVRTQFFYKFQFVSLGKKSILRSPLFITPEFIQIGDRVEIWKDGRFEGVENYSGVDYCPLIIIEDGVTFQQRCHVAAADTLIVGKNSTISFDVMITDIDHQYQDIDVRILNQPLIVNQTRIGENCFVGAGSKILGGTILGKHCVVGANSVVRGYFPEYSVIVGIPAKIVKRYNKITGKWVRTNEKGEFESELQ